jgi:triacylglycerol lipase
MPIDDVLTPDEASRIATNSYFALEGWINAKPKPGIETFVNVKNRVVGPGNAGMTKDKNTSLQGTELAKADLTRVFSGTTGLGTKSGFGYVLQFKKGSRRHAIIATRGTRAEMGLADILTDLRGATTSFGDYGPVHKGFKRTFDSVLVDLAPEHGAIMGADVVHCVGHSLGGGVATLMAAHYASLGKAVKLYTFGSPRVGAFKTYSTLHARIQQENIFRTAHDLDPVSLLASFPYVHVNPSPGDPNNFTLVSPTGALLSTKNHGMDAYIGSVGSSDAVTWRSLRAAARKVDHDNCVLAKWLLHGSANPNWVQRASARTLGILFKLFAHVLRSTSTSVILSLSAVDLLAEMVYNGLCKTAELAADVFALLRHAAVWAGIQIAAGADFTTQVVSAILQTMLSHLKSMAAHALVTMGKNLVPVPLILAGGWALSGGAPL